MTGSLAIVAAFLAGCLAGWASLKCLPSGFSITTFITDSKISSWLLYLLIAQVGLGVGSDPKLGSILRNARPHILLLPAATIAGTLLFSLLVSAVISRWSPSEVIAVGSGFGYYSLSSILITTLKEASIGVQAAAELGTLALIANILREMMTLIFAPVLAKVFGPAAPIAAGGATTMDVTLPVISRASGDKWIVASMIHGFLVDFSVPWIVPFFCSL
ncbi:MAG: lysine exporter LysO family protein [Candidatus Cryptobacteroides sp.]